MDLYPLVLSFLAASSLTMETDTVYRCCLSFSLCPYPLPRAAVQWPWALGHGLARRSPRDLYRWHWYFGASGYSADAHFEIAEGGNSSPQLRGSTTPVAAQLPGSSRKKETLTKISRTGNGVHNIRFKGPKHSRGVSNIPTEASGRERKAAWELMESSTWHKALAFVF